MFRPSRQFIVAVLTIAASLVDAAISAAQADLDAPRLTCDRVSLVEQTDPLSDKSLTSESSTPVPAECPQISRRFTDSQGRMVLPQDDAGDDITISNYYKETVDQFCLALIEKHNAHTARPATACRIGFPSGGKIFKSLLELVRSRQLPILHPVRERNWGYDKVDLGSCVKLPLLDAGKAQNALAQILVREFGGGADWAAISEQLRGSEFKPDDDRSRRFSTQFGVRTGRGLPYRSAEYNSEGKSFSMTLGIAASLPREQFDVGCSFKATSEPNFLCVIPIVFQ